MKLSVIIPCKNEAGTVNQLLESLVRQTLQADEVIVVDSNSTDTTVEEALGFQNRLAISIVTAKEKGVAHARNTGGNAATGDALIFADADTILPPTFVASAVNLMKNGVQAGSFTMRMPSAKASVRIGARVMNGYLRMMAKTPWPIGFTCLFSTKEVFMRLEGFDPLLFIMEDYDYVLRARRLGYRTGVCTTPFTASDRRFINDPAGSAWKGVYGELYRYTHGLRVEKPLFRYDMGGQKPKKDKKL